MRLMKAFPWKKVYPLSWALTLPLVFLTSMLVTSNTAQAALTTCLTSGGKHYTPENGEVIDKRFDSESCSWFGAGVGNAARVRPFKGNGDVVCLFDDLLVVPRGYVVTSLWYDPQCGVTWFKKANRGTLYKAYDNMNACPGIPRGRKFDIPAGFKRIGTKSKPSACPEGTAIVLGRSTQTGTSSESRRGITLTGNGWFQILVEPSYREVYQGPAKFVQLSKGTYKVINLTTGERRKGVSVP